VRNTTGKLVNRQENPGEASVPVNVPWIVPDDVEKLTVPVTALPGAEDVKFMVKVVDVIDSRLPFALIFMYVPTRDEPLNTAVFPETLTPESNSSSKLIPDVAEISLSNKTK
jgi:hypothetical protein